MSKPLLDVLSGNPPSRTPIWFMRQAGRCLPEYRAIRDKMSTLQMFQTPSVAETITLQPLKRFDYDGCIVYADILHVADALGAGLEFERGFGPKMSRVVRGPEDLAFVRNARADSSMTAKYQFVYETLDRVKEKLSPNVTLIGFAGAPWSVATYMIEGRSPNLSHQTKRLMAEHPEVFCELMEHITDITITYLKGQVSAGAEVIQLFESHAGIALTPQQFDRYCYPYVRKILTQLDGTVPRIYYVNGSAAKWTGWNDLFDQMEGFGADYRQNLEVLSQSPLLKKLVLQGNLDPMDLYLDEEQLHQHVQRILAAGKTHQGGFIFNTGHGLTPNTPLMSLKRVVDWVHEDA